MSGPTGVRLQPLSPSSALSLSKGGTRRVALALVAVLAVLLAGCSGAGSQPSATGAGYVSGDGSITQVAVADREPAPIISGPGVSSDAIVTSADHAGKVIVVNVWGSWCPPCRAEADGLQQASVETADVAAFIGINSRDYGQANAEAFLRTRKITYPSIYDPTGAQIVKFEDLPPVAIPSTIVIDEQGRVAARIIGSISETTLVDLIDDVAAGK